MPFSQCNKSKNMVYILKNPNCTSIEINTKKKYFNKITVFRLKTCSIAIIKQTDIVEQCGTFEYNFVAVCWSKLYISN